MSATAQVGNVETAASKPRAASKTFAVTEDVSGMEHAVAAKQAAVVEDMRDGEVKEELNVNPMSWA